MRSISSSGIRAISVALLPVEDRGEEFHRLAHVGDDLPGTPRLLSTFRDPAFADQSEGELEVIARFLIAAGVRRDLGGGFRLVDQLEDGRRRSWFGSVRLMVEKSVKSI